MLIIKNEKMIEAKVRDNHDYGNFHFRRNEFFTENHLKQKIMDST